MPRILTRPLFRKGGLSQTPRPSYRGGGIPAIRPHYRRGGGRMFGVMSGIVDRQPFQTGSTWYKPWTWGGGQSYGDWLKRQIAKTGQTTEGRIASGAKNIIQKGWKMIPERGVGSLAMQHFPKATGAAATIAPLAATVGGLSAMNWPVYPKGHPKEGEFVSKEEAAEIFEKAGDAGTAGDIAGEAAMFDDELPEKSGGKMDAYGNYVYPTKFNWEKPEVVEVAKEQLDLLPKDKKDKIDPLDTTGGEKKLTGDMESDLMRAYKEYAPIFEKELGVSSEDTKKQLWMQLAKFGAGLAAQPGGDLVGAIGKAAEKPLEGAGEVVKDVSTAKRQAKLLALQTAIKEGEAGPIGKAVKDIAKIYDVSEEEAAAIYEKWNARDTTAKAKDTASYRKYGEEKLQVNPYGFEKNIKKLLEGPDADLVGKFNKRLPYTKDGAPDEDEMIDKEYYVGEDGELYRVDKSTDPPTLLQPGDDGFKDSKKKKK